MSLKFVVWERVNKDVFITNFSFYSCLFYVDHSFMKKLELSKYNVDGKYILISMPNELFFLSVEILFSIAIF